MKHNWQKDENGNVDEWAWEAGYHNGVYCVDCRKTVCVHCNPDYMELDDCTGPEPDEATPSDSKCHFGEIQWFEKICERLRDYNDGFIWCNGGDEIMCRSEDAANALADLIESLYCSQGKEVVVNTGYYDPKDDAKNGETDCCTGWWYVNLS